MFSVLDSLDDPRLDPYRELKRTNWTRHSDWFIAEGRWVVRRLLESDIGVNSVLLAETAVDPFRPYLRPDVQVLVLPADLVSNLVGFQFHAGVLACGKRTRQTSLSAIPNLASDRRSTIVGCPHTVLPDNLGSIVRICAAFGVEGMLIGDRSADPYSRRVVRVSMGNIFRMPLVEPADFPLSLRQLRSEFGFQLVAATGSESATPLPIPRPAKRIAILLGNEAHGLAPELRSMCDLEVSIPMSGGTDSLNVATAAAVLLYQFTRVS